MKIILDKKGKRLSGIENYTYTIGLVKIPTMIGYIIIVRLLNEYKFNNFTFLEILFGNLLLFVIAGSISLIFYFKNN